MKKCIRWTLAAVALVTSTAFAGPAEPAKFRVGGHRALVGAWDAVAHRLGYWKEAGLDYEFLSFKQGVLMRNAVIQGNIDVGNTGFAPFVTAISKGAKVMGVAVTTNTCELAGVVVPASSKVQSVKELKGLTVAGQKGTSTDFTIKYYMLPKHGLRIEDINWMSVKGPDVTGVIVSGNAQAGYMIDPQAEIAVQKGLLRKVENLCAYDKPRLMQIANPMTLKAHPELYEKYFRGWLRAHRLLREKPETFARVYVESLKEYGEKAEYGVFLPIVKRLRSEPFITDEVRSYLNDMGAKQIKLGWIKSHPDFTKVPVFDDSIVRKVAKSLGMAVN